MSAFDPKQTWGARCKRVGIRPKTHEINKIYNRSDWPKLIESGARNFTVVIDFTVTIPLAAMEHGAHTAH
jgi:hypothetical protein